MNGSAGIFNFEIRVITCITCGAPLKADLGGGAFTCEYCSTVNHLIGRNPTGFSPTTLPESERIATLRLAVGRSAPAPTMDFVVDGQVPSYFRRKAKEEWKSLRAQVETSRVFVLKEKLFHLTYALVPSLEPGEQRAFLETAVEILDDERYRHILLCQMARMAARNGEVKAAKSWLALCNPRSCDLESDSAFRYAAATLAAVEADAEGIYEQLGFEEGELPLAGRDAAEVRILRIHAKELQGKLKEAGGELYQRVNAVGVAQTKTEIKRHLPLVLCTSSMQWVTDLLEEAEAEKETLKRAAALKARDLEIDHLRAELRSLPFATLKDGVKTALLCAACAFGVSFIATVVSIIAEIDPVFGAAGRIICPNICEGCRPPFRSISWTTTTNGSDEETCTLIFCDDSRRTVSSMTQADLFQKATTSDPALLRYEVSDFHIIGIAMLFYFPILFMGVFLFRIRLRKARRARIERRIAVIEEGRPA